MTCVLAHIDRRGNVHMAADTLYLEGDCAVPTDLPKVFRYRHYLVGVAGEVGHAQQIVQWFNYNEHIFKEEDLSDGQFWKSLKRWYEDHAGPSGDRSFSILLASSRAQTLFTIDDDGSVLTHPKVASIGSGGLVALSVWRTLELCPLKMPLTTKTRMMKALEISAEFVISVRGPFTYERL